MQFTSKPVVSNSKKKPDKASEQEGLVRKQLASQEHSSLITCT